MSNMEENLSIIAKKMSIIPSFMSIIDRSVQNRQRNVQHVPISSIFPRIGMNIGRPKRNTASKKLRNRLRKHV
ncbi:hypothetical protein B4135_0722 [Caldibacillus debilis]|uniref:Uncharacterized protein n=1 Tax=Caldibacillus debilis TaxID=301148 RepID=A0A150M5M1_9BACI|nr:hypothetical protein B4135_0722 [Caldibacillus debilis]